MFKRVKVKDERVESLEMRILASAFGLTFSMLIISMFIKAVIYALPFSEFALEFYIVAVSATFVSFRGYWSGVFHSDLNSREKRNPRMPYYMIVVLFGPFLTRFLDHWRLSRNTGAPFVFLTSQDIPRIVFSIVLSIPTFYIIDKVLTVLIQKKLDRDLLE